MDFQRLAEWAAPKTLKDYQDIVDRYREFGKQVDQVIETLRSAVAKKITNHAVSMKDVAENCRKLANEPADSSAYYKPFADLTCGTKEEVIKLQEDAITAINDSIKPGFLRLTQFLEKQYLLACRPEVYTNLYFLFSLYCI